MPLYVDGVHRSPVAAAEDKVIIRLWRGEDTDSGQFVLFDPVAQTSTDLWRGAPNSQDAVMSYDGEWLAVVVMGHSLPFDEWSLMLRNWRTGEVREIASSDPLIPEYPDLHIGLPLGFAPVPQVRDGVVVWEECFVSETYVGKRIQLYDIETDTFATVAQVADARIEELSSPTHARGKTAWIRRTFKDGKEESVTIDVELLVDGQVNALARLGGRPFIIRFSPDGNALYWDDALRRVKRTDLTTMETEPILTRVGNWPYVSGRYITADVNSRYGNTWIGYYDEQTRVTYTHHIDGPSERAGGEHIFGKWFIWTLLVMNPEDGFNDKEKSRLFFLPLSQTGQN